MNFDIDFKFFVVSISMLSLWMAQAQLLSSVPAPITQSIDWPTLEEEYLAAHVNPKPADDKDVAESVRIYCYTKINSNNPIEIIHNNLGPLKEFCNNKTSLNFITHGFGQNYACSCPQYIKDSAFENRDDSIICVPDWSQLSSFAIPSTDVEETVAALQILQSYHQAVMNTYPVGKYVATVIHKTFIESGCTTLDRTELTGFSLGAQVSGISGKTLSELNDGKKVSRIIGIDPAGPLFYTGSIGRCLTKSDAEFVQGIHTDCGMFGIARSVGHADFFVNGGTAQPGCSSSEELFLQSKKSYNFSNSDFLGSLLYDLMTNTGACSHNTAPLVFAQSMNSTTSYTVKKCSNDNVLQLKSEIGCTPAPTVLFGDQCTSKTTGNYTVEITPIFSQQRKYACV